MTVEAVFTASLLANVGTRWAAAAAALFLLVASVCVLRCSGPGAARCSPGGVKAPANASAVTLRGARTGGDYGIKIDLSGKTALVTGSTGGIGFAIA